MIVVFRNQKWKSAETDIHYDHWMEILFEFYEKFAINFWAFNFFIQGFLIFPLSL
jgi:hypothetical protein